MTPYYYVEENDFNSNINDISVKKSYFILSVPYVWLKKVNVFSINKVSAFYTKSYPISNCYSN